MEVRAAARAAALFQRAAIDSLRFASVLPASRDDNVRAHTDFLLCFCGSVPFGVDVKPRDDDDACGDGTWLELHAADASSQGWLFGGRSKYIAFAKRVFDAEEITTDLADDWLLVSREKLIRFACTLLAPAVHRRETYVRDPVLAQQKLKIYARRGHERLMWMADSVLQRLATPLKSLSSASPPSVPSPSASLSVPPPVPPSASLSAPGTEHPTLSL